MSRTGRVRVEFAPDYWSTPIDAGLRWVDEATDQPFWDGPRYYSVEKALERRPVIRGSAILLCRDDGERWDLTPEGRKVVLRLSHVS